MIPITTQIMGPGIEEEYADVMERVAKLEFLLKPFPPVPNNPEGCMAYLLMCLRREIEAQRLPIPLEGKYWGILGYLVAEGALNYLGTEQLMGELTRILDGTGLLKPRHHPVVVAMLEDFLDYLQRGARGIEPLEQELIEETRAIHAKLAAHQIKLPLDEAAYPAWKKSGVTDRLDYFPKFFGRQWALSTTLFSSFRPTPCRKGPLPAPNPGMVWGGDADRGTP